MYYGNSYSGGGLAIGGVIYLPAWEDLITIKVPDAWFRFDETVGVAVSDSSGNSLDATWTGTPLLAQPTLVAGSASTSVVLDGATDYAIMDSATSCNMTTEDFAAEIWVKTVQTTGNKSFFDKRQNASGAQGWMIGMMAGVPVMYTNKAPATTALMSGSGSIADGAKHHVVFNFERGAGEIWVDGVSVGSGDAMLADSLSITNGTPGRIGNRTYSSSSFTFFGGTMDELTIYRGKTLTADEVATHYAAGA